mgnify:CR=1 FL=1
MRLPVQPFEYSSEIENDRSQAIEIADALNHKKNEDVEVGVGRLILTSANGSRFNITVSNAGSLTATAI